MSLRFRLILSVALMLLISVTLGGGLAWLHAIRSVATEMDAALVVGEHTVQTVIPFIGSTPDVPVALHQLISTFDGDRHLRATLTDKDGEIVARSFLAVPPAPVPNGLPGQSDARRRRPSWRFRVIWQAVRSCWRLTHRTS